jgi:hypothetical protein
MSSVMTVASALRDRLALTRPQPDRTILQLGLASGCTQSRELVSYMYSSQLAAEVAAVKEGVLSDGEWAAVFTGVRPVAPQHATEVAASPEFAVSKRSIEAALEHTLVETDQARLWSQPLSQLLVFIALNCRDGSESRVERVLGSIVRTDARRLEDLRSAMAGADADMMLLGRCIEAVIMSVGSL